MLWEGGTRRIQRELQADSIAVEVAAFAVIVATFPTLISYGDVRRDVRHVSTRRLTGRGAFAVCCAAYAS